MNNYPKLMRHNIKGVIVKFTSGGVGTVVGTGNGPDDFKVGYYSSNWMMHVFTDYKPEIHKTKG